MSLFSKYKKPRLPAGPFIIGQLVENDPESPYDIAGPVMADDFAPLEGGDGAWYAATGGGRPLILRVLKQTNDRLDVEDGAGQRATYVIVPVESPVPVS